MTVRVAIESDWPQLEPLFEYARKQMANDGNPGQWGSTWPPKEVLFEDFQKQIGYVIEEHGVIGGYFAFFVGDDPTYHYIFDGKWLNDHPYGVIHRIASNGKFLGVLHSAVEYAKTFGVDLRIDTHELNGRMNHLLPKEGFVYCGKIYTHDRTERLAYQWENVK